MAIGVAAGCAGADGPGVSAPSVGTTGPVPSTAAAPFEMFGTVSVTVRLPDGSTREWCLLLADTELRRARGLMEVTDLAGYDGMAFRFGAPTQTAFYMFRTVRPLSIAFHDAEGRFVSAADMEPCPSGDPGACPLTGAAAPYTDAVEVPRGGLTRLGLVPGSQLDFAGPCRPRA
jgi:uncharacterized membrane protein (UPF0127 family)